MREPKEPMVIVDGADGWKEARVGGRLVFRFKMPPGVTSSALLAFADHLLKLVAARQHGPS